MRISDWSSDVCSSDLSVPASWCSWALVSCMHSRSASWVANQSKKPLRAAERTPLALKLMMRMGEEPGLGVGDWGLGIGESKGRDLPVVFRVKAGMTPLHVRDRESTRLHYSHSCATRIQSSA